MERTAIQKCKGIVITLKKSLIFTIHVRLAPRASKFGKLVNLRHRLSDDTAQGYWKPYGQLSKDKQFQIRNVVASLTKEKIIAERTIATGA